jgi:hypothetical protein
MRGWWPVALLLLISSLALGVGAKEPYGVPVAEGEPYPAVKECDGDCSMPAPGVWLRVCSRLGDTFCGYHIEFADVTVVGEDGVARSARANAWGHVDFPDLPHGTYQVTASRAGFETARQVVVAPHDTVVYMDARSVEVTGTFPEAAGGLLAFWPQDGSPPVRAEVDAEGGFTVTLKAGPHSVEWTTWSARQVFVDGSPLVFGLQGSEGGLSGRVLDDTGAPVAGARIQWYSHESGEYDAPRTTFLMLPQPGTVVSGDDGRFEVPVTGWVQVDVIAEGFHHFSASYDAAMGEALAVLQRRPVPDTPVTFRVVDARTGDAVPGSNVHVEYPVLGEYVCTWHGASYGDGLVWQDADPVLLNLSSHDGGWAESSRLSVSLDWTSGDRGGCLLSSEGNVVSGTLFSGFALVSVNTDWCDACPAYYRLTLPLRIPPEGLDMELALEPMPIGDAEVRGLVTDLEGRPLGGVQVAILAMDGRQLASDFTADDGTYRVLTMPGYQEVHVYGATPWRKSLWVEEGRNVLDIQVAGTWTDSMWEGEPQAMAATAGSDGDRRAPSGEAAAQATASQSGAEWAIVGVAGVAVASALVLGLREMSARKK